MDPRLASFPPLKLPPEALKFVPHASYDPNRDCLIVRLQEDNYDEEECSPSAVVFRDRDDGHIVGYRVKGVRQVLEGPGPDKGGSYFSGNVVRAIARRTANGLRGLFAEDAERMERIIDVQHLFEVRTA